MRRDEKKPVDALVVLAKTAFGERRHRSPGRIVVTLLVLALFVGLPIYLFWPSPEEAPLLLAAFDQVALPGEAINLCARLEPLGEEQATANVAGRDLHFQDLRDDWREQITTDRDGMAAVEKSFAAANAPVDIIARYAGDGQRQHGTEAKSRVFVWPAESSLLLVDAVSTLPDVDVANLWTINNLDIRPRSGAVESLRAARAKYRIAYLCSAADRPWRYLKLHAWLQRGWAPKEEQLPDGPLLARPCRLPQREPPEFLDGLRERFRGTTIGITGDRDTARLFHAAGWRTFLLGETRDMLEGVTAVKSWMEFKQALP